MVASLQFEDKLLVREEMESQYLINVGIWRTSTLAATLQLEDKLLVREGCSVVDASKMVAAGRTARRPGCSYWSRRRQESFRKV